MAHVVANTTLGHILPSQFDHMKVSFAAKHPDEIEYWEGDFLVMGVAVEDMTKNSNGDFLNLTLGRLDSRYDGLLSQVCKEVDFTGKTGQSIVIRVATFKRVCLIGLGKGPIDQCFVDYGTHFGESVASSAKANQANNVSVILASSEGLTSESKLAAASKITMGILLGTYEDNIFKFESKKPSLKSVDFFGFGGGELKKKLEYTKDIASATIFGRYLVNAHANVLTPEVLAEEAAKIAADFSDVYEAKILDVEQCKKLGMGSYLGAAAASMNSPKFIHLSYKHPSGSIKTKLALVGKGSSFDSCDPGSMGGSAAVLATAKALGLIKPPGVEVHFIVAACEKMRKGMRHGGILAASNGKTIEVNNINADERLALADALVYACNQGVDKIVDLATLTGTCAVALGPSIAGIFTTSDELHKEVVDAAKGYGERFCKLPLEVRSWDYMKSGKADMVNSGVPHDGSITAALFLKQFVDEKIQWSHVEMAAPVWDDKKKAATGFAIPTLVEWVVLNSVSKSGAKEAATKSGTEMSADHQSKKRKLRRAWM